MNKSKRLEQFAGRMRMGTFLGGIDLETLKINFRKDGEIVAYDENDPISILAGEGYEFALSGLVDGKDVRTRAYPVTNRSNGAWCMLGDTGFLDQFASTADGVPVDIEGPICNRLGTRIEVLSGSARKTTGGLTISDLVQVGDEILSHKEYNNRRNRQLVARRAPEYHVGIVDSNIIKGVGFNDIADGFSMEELGHMLDDRRYANNKDQSILNIMIHQRLRSLVARCLGYEVLNDDGTPAGLTELEQARYSSQYEKARRIIINTPRLGVIDATEYALSFVCP